MLIIVSMNCNGHILSVALVDIKLTVADARKTADKKSVLGTVLVGSADSD